MGVQSQPFLCFAAFAEQQKTTAITVDTREFGGGAIRCLMDEVATYLLLKHLTNPCSQHMVK